MSWAGMCAISVKMAVLWSSWVAFWPRNQLWCVGGVPEIHGKGVVGSDYLQRICRTVWGMEGVIIKDKVVSYVEDGCV